MSQITELSAPEVRNELWNAMIAFLLWCLLLIVCWPVALLALLLYPFVWLLLLPFRILGVAVEGVLALVKSVIMLPARVLGTPARW